MAAVQIGTRVRYGGDMANNPGRGAVIGMQGHYVMVALEDGRKLHPFAQQIEQASASRARFSVIEGELATPEEIAALITGCAIAKAQAESARTAAAEAFTAAVEHLKTDYQYSHLTQGQGPGVAAKNIRAELKKAFPKVKFSVRKSSYDAINVIIPKGAGIECKEIEKAVTDKYEAGYFNGMEDIYEFSRTPWSEVFGSVKYVFVREGDD
ncbi:MAG: hypothetical protein B7X29_02450 [Halothiobacillus sp. 13-55-115]|jgi:hypothetical protein|nr:MAG: hypothetical protein B7X29_02450 [Halothiobacillus sp. 13-55-115]